MHIFRWHPELKLSRNGPLVGRPSSLLHQSDLDSACGQHCVLMALRVLGVLKRINWRNLSQTRIKSLSTMWELAFKNYFFGTTANDLKNMFAHYDTIIETRIHRKNQVARALEILAKSGVAIINIQNSKLNHWVLAAGIGGLELNGEMAPSIFLILDPGHSQVALTVWNAILSVNSDGNNRHVYETADGRIHVHIRTIVTIRRRNDVDH